MDHRFFLEQGRIFIGAGRSSEAIRPLEIAAQEHPEALSLLSVAHLHGNDPERAFDAAHRFWVVAPGELAGQRLSACLDHAASDILFSKAIAVVQTSPSAAPHLVDGLIFVGKLLGRLTEIPADKLHYKSGMLLVYALEEAKHFDHAERLVRRCLEQAPDYVRAWTELGEILWRSGRAEESLEPFRQALRLNPAYPWAMAGMGEALRLLTRFEESRRFYNAALSLMPDHPFALCGRAYLDVAAGNASAARSAWLRCLELDPNHQDATQGLEDLDSGAEIG